DYMIPSHFVKLDALPLTRNGKFDRKALPLPDNSRPDVASPYAAATTPTEAKLVALWEQLLTVHPIGIHDDFFDLGGYSLVGAQLLVQVKQEFQVDLPISFLASYPTIAQLAAFIKVEPDHLLKLKAENQRYSYLLKLQSEGDSTPVFCF